MSLTPGTRIGAYEIVGAIGAGGMGEVYRARDTRLERQVALKILPDAFAADADRLMRFEREAKALASLNHPHIAQIYGLEDRALVMELVEGLTLGQLIAAGGSSAAGGRGLAVPEALGVAKQIAEALEAAHDQGIIHRDLKPANVKIKPDGTVKVLDFGLAKALEPASAAGEHGSSAIANSPTISVAGTRAGIILGTAAYMSPEQAAGRPVDKRADIWAFGVVLFEMLTGRPLFDGESATHILAEVLKSEPPWDSLPAATPASIHKLLKRCLEKKPSARLHDIGDARLEIEDAIAGRDASPPAAPATRGLVSWIRWGAVAFTIIAAAAIGRWSVAPPAIGAAVVRFSIDPPEPAGMAMRLPSAVLSPDGSRIALIPDRQRSPLYIRRFDQAGTVAIAGTEGADAPSFSPDSRWVLFQADRKLKKVRIERQEAPLELVETDGLGAAWGPADTVVFNRNYSAGLWRVSAAGGTSEEVTTPDKTRHELGHFWPQFLPDGRVLFTNFSTPIERSTIEIVSLPDRKRTKVVDGAVFARFLPTGHLIYLRSEAVVAAPFDVKTGTLTGAPVPVADDVLIYGSNGLAHISVADNGTMAYVPRSTGDPPSILAFVDRSGAATPITQSRRRFTSPMMSPDGTRIAVGITDASAPDLWLADVKRDVFTRITSGGASEMNPVWTHDGKRIVFVNEQPVFQLFSRTLAAPDSERPVLQGPYDTSPGAITNDDRNVLYDESHPETSGDILSTPLDGGGKPTVILRTRFDERSPALSPDGKWLAYDSNESGRYEIYVQGYPQPTERFQVSHDGGRLPHWSADGHELYFVNRARMMAAAVRAGTPPSFGAPSALFEWARSRQFLERGYSVTPRGGFVMVQRDPEVPPSNVHIILNWFQELHAKLK